MQLNYFKKPYNNYGLEQIYPSRLVGHKSNERFVHAKVNNVVTLIYQSCLQKTSQLYKGITLLVKRRPLAAVPVSRRR